MTFAVDVHNFRAAPEEKMTRDFPEKTSRKIARVSSRARLCPHVGQDTVVLLTGVFFGTSELHQQMGRYQQKENRLRADISCLICCSTTEKCQVTVAFHFINCIFRFISQK